MQALYQWQIARHDPLTIERQFLDDRALRQADQDYFSALLKGVSEQVEAIDATLSEFIDRAINEIDPVELAILRLGVFELRNRLDVPCRVIINENINLAKRFGASQSHKYVNGIIDKVAHKIRPRELIMQRE